MSEESEEFWNKLTRDVKNRQKMAMANAFNRDCLQEPPHPAMPNNPLKGNFKDYLTEIDVSSPCETLPEDYQNHLDRKYVKKSDNLDAFREYCKQLDADDAEIERTEKRLF